MDPTAGDLKDLKHKAESGKHHTPKKSKKKKADHLKHPRVSVHSDAPHFPRERRKTIFELESFHVQPAPQPDIPRRSSQLSKISLDADDIEITKILTEKKPGKIQIKLSPETQKVMALVPGEHLNEEYPWRDINKKLIYDDIYLYPQTSDFLPVESALEDYPDEMVLMGYLPIVDQEDQFFICVTKEARDNEMHLMEEIRLAREKHVRSTLHKVPQPWKSIGEESEVESSLIGTRSPLQTKHEIKVQRPKRAMNFSFRTSSDQRDSYIELGPIHTETFENVEMKLIDVGSQSVPVIRPNESQTTVSTLVDASCQYLIDDLPVYTVSPKELKRDMSAISKKLEEMDTFLSNQNRAWDIYGNDYIKLVPDEDISIAGKL